MRHQNHVSFVKCADTGNICICAQPSLFAFNEFVSSAKICKIKLITFLDKLHPVKIISLRMMTKLTTLFRHLKYEYDLRIAIFI